MSSIRTLAAAALLGAAALTLACSSDPTSQGSGTIALKLTDAPFPFSEVKSVDIFVLRIDAKVAQTSDDDADDDTDAASAAQRGWVKLAEPNAEFDLLTLQNGVTANLGQATLPAGSYKSFRLIIDPSRSSITLTDGTVLDGNSTPNVSFPSAARSGIKIKLNEAVEVVAGGTSTMVIDFDVGESFVMRGNSLKQNGLLFKPVIKATVSAAP